MTIRLPEHIAKEIDRSIEMSGSSFAEWIRRACQDKLDRDSGKTADVPPDLKQAVFEALKELGYEKKE